MSGYVGFSCYGWIYVGFSCYGWICQSLVWCARKDWSNELVTHYIKKLCLFYEHNWYVPFFFFYSLFQNPYRYALTNYYEYNSFCLDEVKYNNFPFIGYPMVLLINILTLLVKPQSIIYNLALSKHILNIKKIGYYSDKYSYCWQQAKQNKIILMTKIQSCFRLLRQRRNGSSSMERGLYTALVQSEVKPRWR